jgi:tape measure domain-containing protein
MAAGDLVVNLKLNGTDFAVEIKRANELLRLFGRSAREAGNQSRAAEGNVTSLMGRIRDVAIVGYSAVGAFHTLKSVMFDWQLSIIETNARIEKMTVLLSGLSSGVDVGTRFRDAAEDMRTMFELAENAPFSLEEMTKSLVKFKAVNLDDSLRTLKGLTDAVAAFGGSEVELHRASVAIMQMAGKGVISMEELRQQLGEAVPSAIRVMARELGMSYFELVDLVSRGGLEAQKGLNALTVGFEKDFGGAAARMMTTWNGMISRLKTKWIQFQLEIGGEDGFFKEAKASLGELIALLDNAEMKEFGKEFGQFLADSIVQLRELLEWIVENRGEIIAFTKSSLAFVAVWQGSKILNSLIRGFADLFRMLRGAAPAFTYLASFHPAMRALSVAVTAVATGAAALYTYGNFAKAADQSVSALTASQLEATGEVDDYADALAKANAELSTMERVSDVLNKIKTNDVFAEWRLLFADLEGTDKMNAVGDNLEESTAKVKSAFASMGRFVSDEYNSIIDAYKWAGEEVADIFAGIPQAAMLAFAVIETQFELLIAKMKSAISSISFKSVGDFFGRFSYERGEEGGLGSISFDRSKSQVQLTREQALQAEVGRIEAAGAQRISAIIAENKARKEALVGTDAAARSTVELERVQRQLASTGRDGVSVIESQSRAVREYSQAFKEAQRETGNYMSSLGEALFEMTPGAKEEKAYVDEFNGYAKFLKDSTVILNETMNGQKNLIETQSKIAEAKIAFDAKIKTVAPETNEYERVLADYVMTMTDLGVAFQRAESDISTYDETLREIADTQQKINVVLPKRQDAIIKAIGPSIDAQNAHLVTELSQLHRLLEEKWKLPYGILDVIKKIESGSSMDLDTQGPLITDKKSMHYGDRAQGLYQVMPKTLKEYPNADMSTVYGQADRAAEQLSRAMAIHGDEIDKLFASYVGGAGFTQKSLGEYGQGYVEKAMNLYRQNLEKQLQEGGDDGRMAAKELAEIDKLNQDKLKKEAAHSREVLALHGQRASEIGRIVLEAEAQIATIKEDGLLTDKQIADKELAIRANMLSQIQQIEQQAAAARDEYDRQTAEIRLGMLTADKDMRLRLEQQLEIDKERVWEQGGATRAQIEERIRAMTERTNKEIIDAENKKWDDLADKIGTSMGNAFASLAVGGESVEDTLVRLVEALRDMVIQLLIIEPLAKAISTYLKGFMPGASATAAAPKYDGKIGFATGGVPGITGLPHGIYRSPTYFPLSNSGLHKFATGTGLLAEAGRAEAILPLERVGADLGVKATTSPINIVINNNAPGVEATVQQSPDGNMIEVMIERLKSSMANDVASGRGGIGTALERTYGLSRVAGAY